jgi:hypothetical protein
MNIAVKTEIEARTLAAELRGYYKGTDWSVRIEHPLFPGDDYRVIVG